MSIGSEFHNGQQSVMAPLLVHHYFNGMEISVLGDRFANGPQLGLTEAKRVPSDWIVAHASWTDNLQNKRLKLRALGEYEPSCPQQIVPLATACNSKSTVSNTGDHPTLPPRSSPHASPNLLYSRTSLIPLPLHALWLPHAPDAGASVQSVWFA